MNLPMPFAYAISNPLCRNGLRPNGLGNFCVGHYVPPITPVIIPLFTMGNGLGGFTRGAAYSIRFEGLEYPC
jgi:hypothetical protein